MGWYGKVLEIFLVSFPNLHTHSLFISYESVQNYSHAYKYKQVSSADKSTTDVIKSMKTLILYIQSSQQGAILNKITKSMTPDERVTET